MKVKFTNTNGTSSDREYALLAGLIPNQEYIVINTNQTYMFTEYELEDFPNRHFNSVIFEKVEREGPQFNRFRNGGLHDRGKADSYYRRGPSPHWYPEGTGNGESVTNLTKEEVAEYMAGYEYNEQYGDKKQW